jgi:hypothetical protein
VEVGGHPGGAVGSKVVVGVLVMRDAACEPVAQQPPPSRLPTLRQLRRALARAQLVGVGQRIGGHGRHRYPAGYAEYIAARRLEPTPVVGAEHREVAAATRRSDHAGRHHGDRGRVNL